MTISDHVEQRRSRFAFLFIVTYGRSGSTLLQGILNAIPGYRIYGENHNALFHIFRAYNHLRIAKLEFGRKPTDPTNAWYGIDGIPLKLFGRRCANVFFQTCLRPQEGTRCIGFKEIRYTREEIDDEEFPQYLKYIAEYFPRTGFIFNVRDAKMAANSGFWQKQERDSVVSVLEDSRRRFTEYATDRKNCFLFDYDRLMADRSHARDLFVFLDEPYESESLEAVLRVRHSAWPRKQKSFRKQ